jgi:aminoglycoside 3-N-acetyltransferase I
MTPHPIRELVPDDIEILERMMTMFGTAFEDTDTYCNARPSREYLRGLLGRDHFIALAALDETEVIGGLAAYVLHKFERERSEIYIYDLAVAESHRRRGVATALIRRLQEISAARGAYVIFVQADYSDPPAIALYTKLGVREEVLHFDIPVPADR